MPGAPGFAEGEDVIVFLASRGPSVPWLVGLGQGVYRVVTSADGLRHVRPGVPVAGAEVPQRLVRGTAGGSVDLRAFETEVRTLASRGAR